MKIRRVLAGLMTVVMTVGQLYVPAVAGEEKTAEFTENVEENWPYSEDMLSEDELLMGFLMGDASVKAYTPVASAEDEEECISEEAGDIAVKAGDSLNPANKCIYDAVVAAYTEIAAGNRSNVFVDVAFPNTVKTSFTSEDLGVPVVTGNSINPEAITAAVAQLGLNRTAIYNALYYDHPYLVYWQDASYGMGWSYEYSCSGYVGSEVLSIVNFKWTTSAGIAYRPDGATADNSGRYTSVDTAKTAAAAVAKTNAQNMVTAAKLSCSTDKEILEYYCVELCKMTSYNYDSLSQVSGANFDGAHGVIYALDNDPATKVVCDGYARTYQMLCDMTEFYSEYVSVYRVTGDARNSEDEGGAHAWNIAVMEDGKGYHIDTTWCDYEYQDNAYMIAHSSGEEIRKLLTRYFLLPVVSINEETNSYSAATVAGEIYTDETHYVPFEDTETVALDQGSVWAHPLEFFNMSTEPYVPVNLLSEENTAVTIGDLTYNRSVLSPVVTVKFNDTTLTTGTDYTLIIKKNGIAVDEVRNAGTYTAVISGKGEYSGTVTKNFNVAAKSITPTITVTGSYKYDGNEKIPTFSVKDNSTDLTAGTDYTAEFSNNTNAGQGTVTVSEVEGGNYTFDDAVRNFTISKADAPQLADVEKNVIYTATSAKATITGMPQGAGDLSYAEGASNVTGSVIVSGWSVSDAGVVTVNFSGGASGDQITLPVTVQSDNYEDTVANVIIHLQDKYAATVTVAEGTDINKTYGDADFTLHPSQAEDESEGVFSFASNNTGVAEVDINGNVHINGVGTATITVGYDSDTHAGSTPVVITVSKKTLTIRWSNTSLVYNRSEQGPTVSYTGKVGNDDLLVSMSGKQTAPGTYTATLSLTGEDADKYAIAAADVTCSYTIAKAPVSNAAVTVDNTVTYNGAEQTVAVNAVMLNGTDIKEYCDVTGNKQTHAGNYTMTISAKETSYYTGSTTAAYVINRKPVEPVMAYAYSFVYTGSEIKPEVTVKADAETLDPSDVVITYSHNINVGVAEIIVSAATGGNYSFTDITGTFFITKTVTEDKKTEGSARFGSSGSVDLNSLIYAGGSAAIKSVSDNSSVLAKEPEIRDGKLAFAFKNDEDLAGKKAVVSIKVSDAANYEDYEIEAELTVLACAHADTEIKGASEANCTDEGYTGDKYCKECGKLLEKGSVIPIDPDKHDYDEGKITKEPTVFEEGERSFTCKRCGHIRTEVIERIPGEEDMEDILEDIDPETDKVDVIKKDKEDGSTETIVTIGDEEVSSVTTDTDGIVTEETKIWIAGLKSSYTYCGEAIKPEIHVYDGLRRMDEGSDYTVSYANNKKSGKEAKLIISFKGNYKTTEKKELGFEIKPAVLGTDVIAKDGAVNAGGKPAANVLFAESGKKVPAKDLDITYSGDTSAAGTISVSVKPASQDYSGSTQAVITVTDDKLLMLENAKVSTDQKKYTYTGQPVSANVTVELDGRELKKGIDYTVSHISNNVEPGTATMVLEAVKGNAAGYVGSRIVTFRIVKGRALEKGNGFVFEMDEKQTYEKGGVKPAIRVLDGGNVLKEGTDYTLKVKGNTKAGGTGSVTVKGKGKYKGSVTLGFTVEASDIAKLGVVSVDAVSGPKNNDPGAVIIDVNGKQLKAGTDYQMVQDMTGPEGGTYMSMIAKGVGNYTGEVRIWYRDIDKSADIAGIKNVRLSPMPYASSGAVVDKKSLEGLFAGRLTFGKDYVPAGYINNTKAGTAKLIVKGIGEYGGVKLISFKVKGRKGEVKGAYRDGVWK